MRKIIVLAVAVVAISLTACDLIGDLAKVNVPTQFSKEFTFDLDQNTQTLNYEKVLGLTGNPDLDQYVDDKLEAFTIKAVHLTVTDYNGSATALFNGDIKYTIEGTTDETSISNIKDLNLSELHKNSSKETITPEQTILSKMAQDFLNNDAIVVHISGNVSEVPVTATVNFTVETDVTIQPLKK